MTSINLFNLDELNTEYNNNLSDYYNTIYQYIEATKINIELTDRILCKIITKEKYQKINILITELNRLLNQYYLPYHIETNNSDISISINTSTNIKYGTIICTFTVLTAITAKLEVNIDGKSYTSTVKVGNTTVEWLDIKIHVLSDQVIEVKILENTFTTITHNNILQDVDLYLLDFVPINELTIENYDQQLIMQNITTVKNKLDCYNNYLNEKINLIKKYKKLSFC